jgi:hypothetical protein
MWFILAVSAISIANYVARSVVGKMEKSLDVGSKQKNALLQTILYIIIDLNMEPFEKGIV